MFNELTLFLLLVIVVLLFLYFKKSQVPKSKTQELESIPIQAKEKEQSSSQTPHETHSQPQKASQTAIRSTRVKKEMPSHAKITKENFKEFFGMRVLVAEDNTINQKVIMGLLGESGIDVIMANNGQEALDILEQDSNFSIILMDAHMPVVDGYEASRTIRANPAYNDIVIVALSGDTAADDIRKMNEAGMQEHLEKPLKMDLLYDIFSAYLYANKTENEQSDETLNILNKAEGVAICGGDAAFYDEILSEFKRDYADSHALLLELCDKGAFHEASKILLDISGVSANIGSKIVSDSALALKEAIELQDETKKKQLLETYNKNFKALLAAI